MLGPAYPQVVVIPAVLAQPWYIYYIFIYIYMYVRTHVCVYACLYVCMYTPICNTATHAPHALHHALHAYHVAHAPMHVEKMLLRYIGAAPTAAVYIYIYIYKDIYIL